MCSSLPLANPDWKRTFSELFQPKLEVRSSFTELILLDLIAETCAFEAFRVALATSSRDRMLLMTTGPRRALALAFSRACEKRISRSAPRPGRLVSQCTIVA